MKPPQNDLITCLKDVSGWLESSRIDGVITSREAVIQYIDIILMGVVCEPAVNFTAQEKDGALEIYKPEKNPLW